MEMSFAILEFRLQISRYCIASFSWRSKHTLIGCGALYAGYASLVYAWEYAGGRLLTSVLILLLVNYPAKVDYTICERCHSHLRLCCRHFCVRIIRNASSITQKIDKMKYPKCFHIKACDNYLPIDFFIISAQFSV